MSYSLLPLGLMNHSDEEEQDDQMFYSVIDRLKAQNALSPNSFLQTIPFFNIPSLPKEVQIRELFEHSCDTELCKFLLKNVAPLPEGAEASLKPQNFSPISVMSFAQIVLFKVLPCPNSNCPSCPREIATHNQYKDFEYECPFYHHDRDRRRLVIFESIDKEFVYKANYFEEGKRRGNKEKYSQNYFESMFHPLYYKMFRCKRDFCNRSAWCPFYHNDSEKKTWDDTFSHFIRKDRVSYIKDKQTQSQGSSRKGSSDESVSPGAYGYTDKRAHVRPRPNRKSSYQQYSPQMYYEDNKVNFDKQWTNQMNAFRKNSDDSTFEENYGYGFLGKLQASIGFEIY